MATSMTPPGHLTRLEQMQFARAAVAVQIKTLPSTIRARFTHLDSSALAQESTPPDSSLTIAAESYVAEHYNAPLYNHCLRCWYFGDFFAQLEGRKYDPELFYISCLFHDIALTNEFRDRRPYACFAVEGADLARSWLIEQGAIDALADNVSEVIAAHLDIHVPPRNGEGGVEPYLLHEAAHLDVAGIRAAHVPSTYTRLVATRHPRDGFATAFGEAMKHESKLRRSSRAAMMWKLGLAIPMRANPLDARANRP